MNQHRVMLDNVELAAGDQKSIAVLFFNLTGQNFAKAEDARQAHALWLNEMSEFFGTKLPLLANLKTCTPEGVTDRVSFIGSGLPQPAPEIGAEYLIKTWPIGGNPIWHPGKLSEIQAETATTRELLLFSANGATLPVLRYELPDRVFPAQWLAE
ncbi:hypothetical protein [Azonexus hydrophilus]|uniref:Uncharacterized protein n=1 Tax=Azonexus hydrophilus TaxID=418702 RepID=A0ABZ2XN85_9RHOO